MPQMIFEPFVIDEYIIKKHEYKSSQIRLENHIHKPLERCMCIC